MLRCVDIANKFGLTVRKRTGQELYYLCPIHDDHHPSLMINQRKNVFFCGPCAAGGNGWSFFAFLQRLHPSDRKAISYGLKKIGL